MSAKIIPLNFDGMGIRISMWDGEPWFVLSDVAKILGIGQSPDLSRRLPDHQLRMDSIHTSVGLRQAILVNESALYKIIFQSRKPIAERFTNWVTEQVLPSIRKTGNYSIDDLASNRIDQLEKLVEPIGRHDRKLVEHDGRITDLENIITISDFKRKDFKQNVIRRLEAVVRVCYGGMCPAIGGQRLIGPDGVFLTNKTVELDHFNGNRTDNRIENAFPISKLAHRRKTAGENFLPAFNEFHRKRLEFEGLPGPLFWPQD